MIEVKGLCRNFQVGDEVVHALNHIDLQIAAGEYVSIMGPSGSGKSTLLYILGLLDVPDSGEYRLAGVNTANMNDNERANARQRDIGFIFQSFHLVPRMTAAENVELPMTLAGVVPGERREHVEQALESVALADRAGHRPDQLSGGQRQRVAIARAIVSGSASPTGSDTTIRPSYITATRSASARISSRSVEISNVLTPMLR